LRHLSITHIYVYIRGIQSASRKASASSSIGL
jgi:hypothetical protein